MNAKLTPIFVNRGAKIILCLGEQDLAGAAIDTVHSYT